MKFNYLFLLIILFFLGCQSETTPERVTFLSTPLDAVYQDLRPAIQSFSISNNQPNQIKAKGGTEIFVPKGAFVDTDGQVIEGEVEVKIVEAFSMEDFITSNLVTLSNGQLLESNGMINFNATAQGKTVELANGKELAVSMPIKNQSMEGFQMFTGNGQNWEVDSSMVDDDDLIPVPLNLLRLHERPGWSFYFGKRAIFYPYEHLGILLTDGKYENTVIATEAFKERLDDLDWMTYLMNFVDQKYNFEKIDLQRINLNLYKIYLENPNRSLRDLDELALQEFIQFLEENKQAFIAYANESNYYNSDYDSYIDIPHEGKPNDLIISSYISKLKWIGKTSQGRVNVIDSHGEDLDSKDLEKRLREKMISEQEINEILTYQFKRNVIIDKLKRKLEAREKRKDAHKSISDFYETTSFSISQLGWINCDRFFDSPYAKPAKILATDVSSNQLNYIDYSLIFPNLNARLSAHIKNKAEYAFTSDSIYSKLPIGEKAFVIGVAFQNDSTYYAVQEIKIEEELLIQLNLQPISKENLKLELAKLVQ